MNEILKPITHESNVARVIAEIRGLLNAGLFVGNMNHVRALLVAYDEAVLTAGALADRAQADRDRAVALQAQINDALALLNQHLSGRAYDDLDDALRNLLQAYVPLKEMNDEDH